MNNNSNNNKIWRYMDFAKFLNLLHQDALFFPKLGILLEDPYEGTVPKKNLEEIRSIINKTRDEQYKDKAELMLRNYCGQRKDEVFICSWHINHTESYLMWKTYCKIPDSVAIVSSIEYIQEAIKEQNKGKVLYVADKVKYINFQEEKIDDLSKVPTDVRQGVDININKVILHKDIAFITENEYRIVADLFRLKPELRKTLLKEGIGFFAPINPKNIIQEVYVHPKSEGWFLDLVNKVISPFGIEAKKSRLTK